MSDRPIPTKDEIIEAHDLLDGILRGECHPVRFEHGEMEDRARVARDVLCWILGHEHGDEAAHNFGKMKQALKDAGITIHRIQ